MSRPLRLALCAALGLTALTARAYNLDTDHWRTTPVTMQLQLGTGSGTLLDGNTSWGAVAEDALATWNAALTNFKFTVVRDSTAARARSNRLNNVFFDSTYYNTAFGTRVLAITLISTSSTNGITNGYSETDVVFNTAVSWNSYRGNLRFNGSTTLNDFRRVAIHEFGHALGLDHPDDIGQSVAAVMNATISNTDTAVADDIAGARAIYDSVATAPGISTQPASQTITAGQPVTFSVTATGTAPLTYQWRKNGTAISGATAASYTLSSVIASDAGNYTVVVTNSVSSVTSSTAVLTVNTAAVAPTISVQPVSQTVTAGSSVSFSVTAAGSATLAYQWRKNGTAISGATSATYTITSTAAGDAASYTVVVSNSAGSLTSSAATLTVNAAPTGPTSRLSNLSVLTTLALKQVLTVGFTMTGGSKQVLVRAVGPGLTTLGLSGTMPDPQLTLYANSVKTDANDDWLGTTTLANAMAAVGAFPLPAGSFDAALLKSITGGNTVEVTGSVLALTPNTNSGTVIVELYDTGSANSPRLTNISALNQVGTGANILIAGFTITGTGTKNVLIRAVGPTLGAAPFNIGGVLADPKLEIYNSSQVKIDHNDNWSSTLATTFSSVGAFALVPGSKDAAIIVTLPAGGYTVQVSGADGGTGTAIVELYELP